MSPRSVTAYPLDDEHQRVLLELAADSIGRALLRGDGQPEIPEPTGDLALDQAAATFVTLERGEALLGCIGTLEPVRPLAVDVAHNAIAAAFSDPRLPELTVDEYAAMSIKVSVLSHPEPMTVSTYDELAAAVRPGTDGLLLEAGSARSTLLPSVWPKVRDVAEFLDVLWRKGGLRPGTWRTDSHISRYTTEEFGDPGPRAHIDARAARRFSARR